MAVGVYLLYVIAQPSAVNNVLFAAAIALCSLADSVDGAVARLGRGPTHWGSYLDAMNDRIFDASMILSVAFVSGHWVLCFLITVGSYTISYAKARAVMEMRFPAPDINNVWPDMMERTERNLFLGLS